MVKIRQTALLGLWVLTFLALSPQAGAYYVLGNWTDDGRLVIIKWPFTAMDTNHDGDVSGPDDGIEFTLEGGQFGWLDSEIPLIEEAFGVWESVPTAYAAFRLADVPLYEPVPNAGTGPDDQINLISVAVAGDNLDVGGLGIFGDTLVTYFTEDDVLIVDEYQIPVTANKIIDADIVIDGATHRNAILDGSPSPDLVATLVTELGRSLGLTWSPVSNVSERLLPTGDTVLREMPAVALRDATGQLQRVGVTPSMFIEDFEIQDNYGVVADGARDLAPADIAAVSFLYPRGSQDLFFNIAHKAQTKAGHGFPSLPIVGAHIVAWCDADDDPLTPNVPIFSTITGMNESVENTARRGYFNLQGLFKRFENASGVTFQAAYVLTLNPFDGSGYARQALPDNSVEDFDSFHSPDRDDARTDYTEEYPTQVFVNGGNIYDITKRTLGTPLVWDPTRGTVVDAETDESLAAMLPGQTPMFGTRSRVCPFNVTTAGLKSNSVSKGLRRFRDSALLGSAVGVALADVYYRNAPAMAEFMLRHDGLRGTLRGLISVLEWGVAHYSAALFALFAGAAALVIRRRRKRAVALGLLLILGALIWAAPAHARIMHLTESEITALSEDIIAGQVTNVDSHWVAEGVNCIVTDVTITIADTVKGRLNKNGEIQLRLRGGRVGSMVTESSSLPRFEQGEEVLLYLHYRENLGYAVVAGARGKYEIETNAETGEKYVRASTAPAKTALSAAEAAVEEGDSNDPKDAEGAAAGRLDGKVPLEEFKQYLREIVKKQEADEKKAPKPAE